MGLFSSKDPATAKFDKMLREIGKPSKEELAERKLLAQQFARRAAGRNILTGKRD